MSRNAEKAEIFSKLHVKGQPIILFNIWDAGTARAVADAGAVAIATGSWSVAAANGFADGENVPLALVLDNLRRITAAVDMPVTLDFEGGYATDAEELKGNTASVIDAGAVGINFEDQIVGGDGIYPVDEQARRIAAVRSAAAAAVPLFINARTDVFLKSEPSAHASLLADAVDRGQAYADAGASGLFAPGLKDPALIRQLCEGSTLPVNIMVMADTPSTKVLAELGVARISYGPTPYRQMIESLRASASRAFAM